MSATATLGGTAAGNYTVTNPVTTTAKINPRIGDRHLHGGRQDLRRDEHGQRCRACAIATGKVGSDDVTCSVASGTFASANASESTQTVSATATLGGTAAGNYTHQSGDVTATIGKATATVAVTPYNVTYDATAHTATGSATGIGGVSLSGLDLSGTTHTNAGTTTDTWTFTDSTGNYNNATDTVVDKIAKADASVVVNGYSGTYDAAAHGATLAHATGVGGVNLSGGVSLGDSFTNVPGGTAHWTFSAANYNDQSGDVAITIGKATATVR